MTQDQDHVKVELSFGDIRNGRVVEGAPGDQRVRVEVPGITDRVLVEKHPYRPRLYRPLDEATATVSPPTIEIPWWLDMILTVVGFVLMVVEIVVMALRASYESIPQKTWDRLAIIYGGAALGALLVIRWYVGTHHMDRGGPGYAYALGLQAIVGWGILYAGLWRMCAAGYPFDPPVRASERATTDATGHSRPPLLGGRADPGCSWAHGSPLLAAC